MFTGIIETLGTVISVEQNGSNRSFWIRSAISKELKVDQSVSHEGVCLTIEEVNQDQHRVIAVEETLTKSNLNTWETGKLVNLERSLQLASRLDGHLVQGHVDTQATCISRMEKDGSWEFEFELAPNIEHSMLMVEKGSIAINGTSLTLFNVRKNRFSVAIIPFTLNHTSINNLFPGDRVNVEFDIIGKYILRNQQLLKYS